VVLVTASWSATIQTPNGPVQGQGFWGGAYVRDGGAWKARLAVLKQDASASTTEKNKRDITAN